MRTHKVTRGELEKLYPVSPEIKAAYLAGRTSMREECAEVTERGTSKTPEPAYPHGIRMRIAAAIRRIKE